MDGNDRTFTRIDFRWIQFQVGSVRRAIRQNLKKMLQSIISLVLLAVFDDSCEKILLPGIDHDNSAQLSRPEPSLLSVWDYPKGLLNVRHSTTKQHVSN